MLEPDEPAPFSFLAGDPRSLYVITCDHAGRRLPRALGTLGLPPEELDRHIAWDIGAAEVARHLGAAVGGVVITQTYSRLCIDCNRPLHADSSIVKRSESTDIPGNQHVTSADAAARAQAIFQPYHDRIRRELDERAARQQPTVFIALHSFTPVYLGDARPWHAGILYNRDTRLAHDLLARLRRDPALVVGDNEPYAVTDASDYGVNEYGEQRGLPYVEIEIRQDLIADPIGQRSWAERLAGLLRESEAAGA